MIGTIASAALIALLALGVVVLGPSVRIIKQFERGAVLRFGKVRSKTRGPGLALIMPIADRLHKVNMRIITTVSWNGRHRPRPALRQPPPTRPPCRPSPRDRVSRRCR